MIIANKKINQTIFELIFTILFIFLSAINAMGMIREEDNELVEGMANLSIGRSLPSNIRRDGINSKRHTHTPQNGSTLYITGEATLFCATKRGNVSLQVVPAAAKDVGTKLNHQLYFHQGLDRRANHLLASLGITYAQTGSHKRVREVFYLTWNSATQKFAFFLPAEIISGISYANFYNHTKADWKTANPIDVDGKEVKLVTHSHQNIPGVVRGNSTHSEPCLLSLLSSRKRIIADAPPWCSSWGMRIASQN